MKWILIIFLALVVTDEVNITDKRVESMQAQIAAQHNLITELEKRIYDLEKARNTE